jgi:hypothetical protein
MRKITLSLIFTLTACMAFAQSWDFIADAQGWVANDADVTLEHLAGYDEVRLELNAGVAQNFVGVFNNTNVEGGVVNPSSMRYLHIVANVVPSTVKILNLRFVKGSGGNRAKEFSNFLSTGSQTYTIDMDTEFGTDWTAETSIANFRIRFVNQASAGNLTPETDIAFIDKIVFSNDAVLSVSTLEKFNFSFYPNPAKNNLYLNANKPIQKIQVYSILGKEAISVNNFTGNSLDISNLAKGMYLAKVYINDAVGTFKFVKN